MREGAYQELVTKEKFKFDTDRQAKLIFPQNVNPESIGPQKRYSLSKLLGMYGDMRIVDPYNAINHIIFKYFV